MYPLKSLAGRLVPALVVAVTGYVSCGEPFYTPTVQVTSPDGGEYWAVGSTETVTWISKGDVGTVAIELSVDGGANWTTLAASTPNDRAEEVAVPDSPGTECLVRVVAAADGAMDVSDASFVIGPPYVKVLSPDGGETWYVGETREIAWEAAGVAGDVGLSLVYGLNGSIVDAGIGLAAAADGSYEWTVPAVESDTCRVSVTDVGAAVPEDLSDAYFTIMYQPVRVASPNGGEMLPVGGICTITWSVHEITGDVEIHYSTDGGATYPDENLVATVAADALAYTWSVPDAVGEACRVRVRQAGGAGEADESDGDFTITPGAGSWAAMNDAGAPGPGRAFWTGDAMLVWTGEAGGFYDPDLDSWNSMDMTGAPTGRTAASAVWTGSKLVVWGGSAGSGYLDTGAVYDRASDSWSPTDTSGAPGARGYHAAAWFSTASSSGMIVWGGLDHVSLLGTGGVYDPDTDSWSDVEAAGAPSARTSHTAVWTGTEMIFWGGADADGYRRTGGAYDPDADSWRGTTTVDSPTGRAEHAAVWTGSRMAVWGGRHYDYSVPGIAPLGTGALYDPVADAWQPMSEERAPTARTSLAAAAAGGKVIVWGGIEVMDGLGNPLADTDTGGVYDAATDSWTATTAEGAPGPRFAAGGVWTGTGMIVWGGWHRDWMLLLGCGDGAVYTP